VVLAWNYCRLDARRQADLADILACQISWGLGFLLMERGAARPSFLLAAAPRCYGGPSMRAVKDNLATPLGRKYYGEEEDKAIDLGSACG
jgi:hypothetical protein